MSERRIELDLRPAPAPRIGRSGRIDPNTDIGQWDYAAELYPPGSLDPLRKPTRLVWAHRVDHAQPGPSPEMTLDLVLGLWAEWALRFPSEKPWLKGRRPFTIKPEDWP